MKTSIARIALVTAALFAPVAAVAANIETHAGISIPVHKLNFSPAFTDHPRDQSLLTTTAPAPREPRPTALPQIVSGFTLTKGSSISPIQNANVKQVETIMKNLFPSSTARHSPNPAFLVPRVQIANPSDAELAEARQKVDEATIRLQEATTRLQQLSAQHNAARTMQGEFGPAEKTQVQPDPKP